MEQLKTNRWVVLLIGVILIFICAGTVWASNDVRPSNGESASVGMGACELTDVAFDGVLHPEFTLKTASLTSTEKSKAETTAEIKEESKEEQTAKSLTEKQQENSPSATKEKTVSENTSDKEKVASSKTNQTTDASQDSDKQKDIQNSKNAQKQKNTEETVETVSVSTQKPAAVATADDNADHSVTVKTAAIKEAAVSSLTPPKQLFFTKTALLSQDQASEATWTYALSNEDLLLLQRIVMAEAEGEPYAGKVAVANVVLNRLRSANYPDTIRNVIYQRYQFSPVQNGRFDRVVPSEDSIKAAAEALNGRKEVPDDTYYFVSLEIATDMTVPNTRTPVKKIGHHTFFK
ncbi:cell wall hydrolase [Saccharibacillus kuerlensis]|uniref:Cell wall hydrolase SleB domain-containing protein n=1 Tax=Saccharibacillus kuerlensis TaxID=459527 RepID=A0ABQ2L0Y2_9BACL|nr:cell wall hydrolase [Saccharibacillus kuerlensis]GGN99072.1 hypothetical protein GCM10010969_18900 [Saccharibacillus kuerlensis]